jgi:NADH-quinone oxidoreductase subunit N
VNLPELGSPLVLETGLALLMLIVFFVGLFTPSEDKRRVGVLAGVGLVVLLGVSLRTESGTELFRGAFVQDELAVFTKRLFLLATLIGVLASLPLRAVAFARRATEYYLAILASLLGMLVLASARDLILLFVAFELMSIPLYYLAGFLKREETAVEAALKFFLVGTVSSAVLAYGLSFMYGIAGTTDVRGVAQAVADGHPMMLLGMLLTLGGLGFKIAAFPFHMWVPDTYEAASTPFVAWLSVAPKAAGFVVIFRLYLEGMGDRVLFWVPAAAGLATVTVIGGNLMALPTAWP